MKSLLAIACLSLTLSACAPADSPEEVTSEVAVRPDAQNPINAVFEWPEGWEYRLDGPAEGLVITGDSAVSDPDVYFTNMTPGWHATTKGAAGIFWHPASTAEGDYSASATIFLFDPGTRNEAYGIFVGGSDLAGEDQRYLYFLLRRSGEFLVKERNGQETSTVVDWTPNEAIAAWTEESSQTIENNLGVRTEGNTITFVVNGTDVHSMDKGDLAVDGLVGIRLNHGLNVHISGFDVVQSGNGG
jgi:hypothetical protein